MKKYYVFYYHFTILKNKSQTILQCKKIHAAPLMKRLLDLVDQTRQHSRHAKQFYDLITTLLTLPGTGDLKTTDLLFIVCQFIKDREIVETRESAATPALSGSSFAASAGIGASAAPPVSATSSPPDQSDKMLCGLLDLCYTILTGSSSDVKNTVAQSGFLDHIVWECLFSCPAPPSPTATPSSILPVELPKCKVHIFILNCSTN